MESRNKRPTSRLQACVLALLLAGCKCGTREVETAAELEKLLAEAETNALVIVHFTAREEGGGTLSLYRAEGVQSLYSREDYAIDEKALVPDILNRMSNCLGKVEGLPLAPVAE